MTTIAIIGAGPAGVMAGIQAAKSGNKVEIFDKSVPLKTLLYTGGGRCNLSYAEYDFKKLVKFYPRGEKFLLSPFSKFGVADTQKFFEDLGLKTYIQSDNRIFPKSNKAVDVQNILLDETKSQGIKFINEEVQTVTHEDGKFVVNTDNSKTIFDKLVIATGGNRLSPKHSGYSFAKALGHTITPLKPALCGLKTREVWCQNLSGLSIKDVKSKVYFQDELVKELSSDLLFTHKGISGPLAYKISSYCAFYDFSEAHPLTIKLDFVQKTFAELDKELTEKLNTHPKKEIFSLLTDYIPKSLLETLLYNNKIDAETKACQLSKVNRHIIINMLISTVLEVIALSTDGEVVTAGGVDLDEVDNKTMQSKIVNGLYFCGEVLNIDGLTGGFNLQACWTTGYIAGSNIK